MASSIPPTDVFQPPKVLTYPSTTPPTLVTQGAEARLYKTTYLLPTIPCALKYRPPKPYRHPVLDARLTRARILAEARILARCRRDGVSVPKLYMVDEAAGWMMMEWVEGEPVRVKVNEWLRLHAPRSAIAEETEAVAGNERSVQHAAALTGLMARIGAAVGQLHAVSIVHGDLTTSNMILRPWPDGRGPTNEHAEADGLLDGEIVLIDFGLASQATQEEERAVDLYVLEKAFASTHPRAEALFSVVLQSYKETFKHAESVLRRLEDVRMRGRKRSMVG